MRAHMGYSAFNQLNSHGDVVVPTLEGLLVHPDVAQRERPAAFQPAADRAALDAPHGVPPQLELAGDRGHRRFPQPVDRQPLEQQGELRAWRRPGHGTLEHAMRRTVDAGDAGVQPRLKLARVEVSPLSLAVVVDRLRRLALWALRRSALVARQPHVHRAAGHIELDPLHPPRGLHPQDRRVQLVVPHRPDLLGRVGRRDDSRRPSDRQVTHTNPGRAAFDKCGVRRGACHATPMHGPAFCSAADNCGVPPQDGCGGVA